MTQDKANLLFLVGTSSRSRMGMPSAYTGRDRLREIAVVSWGQSPQYGGCSSEHGGAGLRGLLAAFWPVPVVCPPMCPASFPAVSANLPLACPVSFLAISPHICPPHICPLHTLFLSYPCHVLLSRPVGVERFRWLLCTAACGHSCPQTINHPLRAGNKRRQRLNVVYQNIQAKRLSHSWYDLLYKASLQGFNKIKSGGLGSPPPPPRMRS